ncbi:MAG: type II toxin-antitoxin system VapC family toxin [Burkholderiaceae bacterium]|nr:type II toxin-antitoxin system VapC family toxin [Burkholderiaceae bacterium]
MVYLDASFVIPILIPEKASAKVERIVTSFGRDALAVSSWTRLECASVVARLVRMRVLAAEHAQRVVASLDDLIDASFRLLVPGRNDFGTASEMIAQSGWRLRSADALHLAIMRNHKADRMLTRDAKLIELARDFGLPVSSGGA